MLRSFWRRKDAPVVKHVDVEDVTQRQTLVSVPVPAARPPEPTTSEAMPVRRDRQKNIKLTSDCLAVFEALMKEQAMSAADLFEDLVAERQAKLIEEGKFRQAAE
jgi:hypothetical protein